MRGHGPYESRGSRTESVRGSGCNSLGLLGPRLCENSKVKLSRRTFVSNTLNKKRTALAGTAERRKERTQFCSLFTRARFHTAWTPTGHFHTGIAYLRRSWTFSQTRVTTLVLPSP